MFRRINRIQNTRLRINQDQVVDNVIMDGLRVNFVRVTRNS